MSETLFNAYLPLILWTSLGLLCYRLLPQVFPRLLGRSLYWVGIPVEILALARRTDFSNSAGIASLITITALVIGCCLAAFCLLVIKRLASPKLNLEILYNSATQGSFVLASVLGNTGFVGLAIAPSLIADNYLNWIVFYSITHNLIGTYGFGVLIASYFSNDCKNRWWIQLRAILSVPSLWAFVIGRATQSVPLPQIIASGLQDSIKLVIPCAFVLIGLRLSQLKGWKSLQLALIPAVLKVIVAPGMVGAITTLCLNLSCDQRLAMVLMSGMPCAFAGLILAEEYNLNRELIASSIVVSTLLWLFVLPFLLAIFGH